MHFIDSHTFRTVQHLFFIYTVDMDVCNIVSSLVIHKPFTPSADNIFWLNVLPLSTLLLYCIVTLSHAFVVDTATTVVVPILFVQECCLFVAIKKCNAALVFKKCLNHMHVLQ